MADRALIVDGVDLGAEAGLVVRSGASGIRGSVPVSYPTQRVPDRFDAVRTATKPQHQARSIVVPGTVVADDMATMHQRLHQLKSYLAPGPERTVRLVDDETVEFLARVQQVDGQPVRPDQIQPWTEVAIRFQADDPRIWDVDQQNVGIDGTPTAMPLGTAPVAPVVRIDGSATNPALTYADDGGATVETLSLTISIGAGDWIEVDMDRKTIVDQAGASQISALSGGDFFRLDPTDGDYATSSWPQVSVSSGTGTVTYRKAYF